MTGATIEADRGAPNVRVLLGTERFSSQHSWSELIALMSGGLQATVDVQWCPPGAFAERARDESIDVVVPLWAELDAETIDAGQFGLIQQFGAGIENIDIAAATSAGVWVAAGGALIDEAAVLEALDEGRLAGAGLDVFTHEPYPASAPLAHHPKVIATAHNAALTTNYFRRAAQALGEGLAAQLDGHRPPNALNAPTQPRQIPIGLLAKRHP